MMGTLCIALGVGMMLVAHDLVVTVFGPQWTAAIPFFRWLAIFGIFAALGRPLMPLFFMRRQERAYALLTLVQVVTTFSLVVFAAHHFELVAVAAARTLAAVAFFIVLCTAATRISPVRLADFARVLWRPAFAACAMIFAVRAVQATGDLLPILGLIRDCTAGAVAFGATQIALWGAAGRPPGPERILIDQVRVYLGKAPPAGAVRA
jgi:lipopolysaccharide exporter